MMLPAAGEARLFLRVEDLGIAFEQKGKVTPVVRAAGFELRAGETLGIVGESGSGKTLTCLSLLGLLPPGARIISGSVILNPDTPEENFLLRLSEKDLQKIRGREISMIFQEPMSSLNPSLTCGYQVAEALMKHKNLPLRTARGETLHWFGEVKLPKPERIYRAYPHELSGGQQQRVMIAMASCTLPAVLIADEPTTALDVTIQHAIIQLLKDLQDKFGMSILFISHDLALVSEIAHRIMVMQEGKIVEQGRTSEVMEQPVQPYTKGLLNCRPPLRGKPARLPTVREYLENTAAGLQGYSPQIQKKKTGDRPTGELLLEVSGLTVEFSGKGLWHIHKVDTIRAVDNISFSVNQGETLGLVGESGCGKTSLGRSLLHLIETSSGRILYRGINTLEMSKKELKSFRKKFQIIFQDPYSSLNPRITAGRAIMEPMLVHGIGKNNRERKQMVIELLEKVRLDPAFFNRFPHEFSGGQRQRIGIARVLALKPEFIICDESVSSLDVSVQAEILNLLNTLKEEFHLTYIFISHDLSVVRYMSDRIMVMQEGKLVEVSGSDVLFDHPQKAYTRELINAIPGRKTLK